MSFTVNRGKVILENWEKHQKELNTFSGRDAGLERDIKTQKYVFLRAGLARLDISPTIDERIYAGIIQAMLKNMLREFFPNLILRKINEWKERYLIRPRLTSMFKAQREENLSSLDKSIHQMGIIGLSGHLKAQLDFEREKIALPISGRFEQEHVLAVTLQLEKDGFFSYTLARVDAHLTSAEGNDRKCSIPGEYKLHINHVLNLLKGSAVHVATGTFFEGEKWLQLDFDRIDSNKNASVCEIILEDHHSVEKMLRRTAGEIGFHGINTPEVIEIIKTGTQVAFNLEKTGRFYLQADPRSKAVQFLDEHQHVIPTEKLKQQLSQHRPLTLQKSQAIKKLKILNDKNRNKGIEL